jgi:hypothetical protein
VRSFDRSFLVLVLYSNIIIVYVTLVTIKLGPLTLWSNDAWDTLQIGLKSQWLFSPITLTLPLSILQDNSVLATSSDWPAIHRGLLAPAAMKLIHLAIGDLELVLQVFSLLGYIGSCVFLWYIFVNLNLTRFAFAVHWCSVTLAPTLAPYILAGDTITWDLCLALGLISTYIFDRQSITKYAQRFLIICLLLMSRVNNIFLVATIIMFFILFFQRFTFRNIVSECLLVLVSSTSYWSLMASATPRQSSYVGGYTTHMMLVHMTPLMPGNPWFSLTDVPSSIDAVTLWATLGSKALWIFPAIVTGVLNAGFNGSWAGIWLLGLSVASSNYRPASLSVIINLVIYICIFSFMSPWNRYFIIPVIVASVLGLCAFYGFRFEMANKDCSVATSGVSQMGLFSLIIVLSALTLTINGLIATLTHSDSRDRKLQPLMKELSFMPSNQQVSRTIVDIVRNQCAPGLIVSNSPWWLAAVTEREVLPITPEITDITLVEERTKRIVTCAVLKLGLIYSGGPSWGSWFATSITSDTKWEPVIDFIDGQDTWRIMSRHGPLKV